MELEADENDLIRVSKQIQEDEALALMYYLASPVDDSDDPRRGGTTHCCICFERLGEICLEPCLHRNVCSGCVGRLLNQRCPTCRQRISRVHSVGPDDEDMVTEAVMKYEKAKSLSSPTELSSQAVIHVNDGIRENGTIPTEVDDPPCLFGRGVCRSFREMMEEKKRREDLEVEKTIQVLLVGASGVGKKELVGQIISAFPVQEDRKDTMDEEQEDLEEVETSEERDLGERQHADQDDPLAVGANDCHEVSLFRPNSCVSGTLTRFSVLEREALSSRRIVLDDVKLFRPDCLLICCAIHSRRSFDLLQAWDRILRNNFATPRIWVLLESADLKPPVIDFRDDLGRAISAVPILNRPATHRICLRRSWETSIFDLAETTVSMAKRSRGTHDGRERPGLVSSILSWFTGVS